MSGSQATQIHNERTKLTAAAINTVATSSFTVGALAPLAAAIYVGSSAAPVVTGSVIWIGWAVALHFGARRFLGRLR
jgi:hypothetical protein